MMRFYYLTNNNDPHTTKLSTGTYVYAWSMDKFSLAVYTYSMIILDGDEYYISHVDCNNKESFKSYLVDMGLMSSRESVDDLQVMLSNTPWFGYQGITRECIDQLVDDPESIVYTVEVVISSIINLISFFNVFTTTDFLMEKQLLESAVGRMLKYRPRRNAELREFVCERFDVAALMEYLWGFEMGLSPITPEDLTSEEFINHCTILEKGDRYYG